MSTNKVNINIDNHKFNVPINSLGLHRKMVVESFTLQFDTENFIVNGNIKHYDANGNPITMSAIKDIPDTFIGDRKLYVNFDQTSPQFGAILNPNRESLEQTIENLYPGQGLTDLPFPYTTQYEFIYHIYNTVIYPLLSGLFTSYTNWKE